LGKSSSPEATLAQKGISQMLRKTDYIKNENSEKISSEIMK
jgi:hypothetical protein